VRALVLIASGCSTPTAVRTGPAEVTRPLPQRSSSQDSPAPTRGEVNEVAKAAYSALLQEPWTVARPAPTQTMLHVPSDFFDNAGGGLGENTFTHMMPQPVTAALPPVAQIHTAVGQVAPAATFPELSAPRPWRHLRMPLHAVLCVGELVREAEFKQFFRATLLEPRNSGSNDAPLVLTHAWSEFACAIHAGAHASMIKSQVLAKQFSTKYDMRKEAELMMNFASPFFVRLLAVSALDAMIVVRRPAFTLGEMFKRRKGQRVLAERIGREALWFMYSLLRGLAQMHDAGFAHRGVDLESLYVVKTPGSPSKLVIGDMGFACSVVAGLPYPCHGSSPVGDDGVWPSSFAAAHGSSKGAQAHTDVKQDIWDAGIVLHHLLFSPEHTLPMVDKIRSVGYPSEVARHVADVSALRRSSIGYQLAQLLPRLLHVDPAQRCTATECRHLLMRCLLHVRQASGAHADDSHALL